MKICQHGANWASDRSVRSWNVSIWEKKYRFEWKNNWKNQNSRSELTWMQENWWRMHFLFSGPLINTGCTYNQTKWASWKNNSSSSLTCTKPLVSIRLNVLEEMHLIGFHQWYNQQQVPYKATCLFVGMFHSHTCHGKVKMKRLPVQPAPTCPWGVVAEPDLNPTTMLNVRFSPKRSLWSGVCAVFVWYSPPPSLVLKAEEDDWESQSLLSECSSHIFLLYKGNKGNFANLYWSMTHVTKPNPNMSN